MKKWLAFTMAILMLLGLSACAEKHQPLAAKQEPILSTDIEGNTVLDVGTFSVRFSNEFIIMEQSQVITDNAPFIEVALSNYKNPDGSGFNIVRSNAMAGGDAGRIRERDAVNYVKKAVGDSQEISKDDVTLETIKVGDRSIAVISFKYEKEGSTLRICQYILNVDDCGYIFTFSAAGDTDIARLTCVMDSLEFNYPVEEGEDEEEDEEEDDIDTEPGEDITEEEPIEEENLFDDVPEVDAEEEIGNDDTEPEQTEEAE